MNAAEEVKKTNELTGGVGPNRGKMGWFDWYPITVTSSNRVNYRFCHCTARVTGSSSCPKGEDIGILRFMTLVCQATVTDNRSVADTQLNPVICTVQRSHSSSSHSKANDRQIIR